MSGSTTSLRAAMVPLGRRVRAYFAPVQRETESAAVFDPAKQGRFALDSPPAPWIDLGWIANLRRSARVEPQEMRAGARGASTRQFRGAPEARVEFDFLQWGKLQMALAGGSEHMNVLAADPAADARASGGRALSAAPLLPGSTARELVFGAGAVDFCAPGDLLAVDVDYDQQSGYVGTGIAAAYVREGGALDRDYIRRVTFNVGRVQEKTASSVVLAQGLLGGQPAAAASAQRVMGFVGREGGSFFQEWSALLVGEEESGGRVRWHYPRLSPSGPATGASLMAGETEMQLGEGLRALGLHAAFAALPGQDPNDGEQAVCYRSYFPAAMSAVY